MESKRCWKSKRWNNCKENNYKENQKDNKNKKIKNKKGKLKKFNNLPFYLHRSNKIQKLLTRIIIFGIILIAFEYNVLKQMRE